MKIKLLSIILILVCCTPFFTLAAGAVAEIQLTIDVFHNEKRVSVSGVVPTGEKVGLFEKEVSILVLRPDGSLASDTEYARQKLTEADGSFEFSYNMQEPVIEARDYIVRVNSQGVSMKSDTYRYYSQAMVDGILASLFGAVNPDAILSEWNDSLLRLDMSAGSPYSALNSQGQGLVKSRLTEVRYSSVVELQRGFNDEVKTQTICKAVNEAGSPAALRGVIEANAAALSFNMSGEYALLSDNEKTQAMEMVYNSVNKPFARLDILAGSVGLSVGLQRVNTASWEKMEAAIVNNNTYLGLPLTDTGRYTSLSAAEKENLFRALRRGSNDPLFAATSALLSAFNSKLDEIIRARGGYTPPAYSGGGGGGGGSYGGGTSIIIGDELTGPKAIDYTPIPQSEKIAFNDLDDADWAAEAIMELVEMGIVSGRDSNTFAPNENITRAEFVKLIIMAFYDLDSTATADYTDTSADDWFYPYVATAGKLRVANGTGDGSFGANEKITRQDMAVMVYRVMVSQSLSLPSVNEDGEFADINQVSDYAREAVSAMQAYGIINGVGDGVFAPELSATRAAAAKIIYYVLDKTERGGMHE